jgi:hypothetical protein
LEEPGNVALRKLKITHGWPDANFTEKRGVKEGVKYWLMERLGLLRNFKVF